MTRGKPRDGSKNPGGAPVKWTEEALCKLGNDLIAWFKESETNVFFKEFLMDHDLYDDMIGDYKNKFKSFSDLIKKAEELQEQKLAKLGVFNVTNPAMTCFVLKNKHKWADKQEVDQTTKFTGSLNLEDKLFG